MRVRSSWKHREMPAEDPVSQWDTNSRSLLNPTVNRSCNYGSDSWYNASLRSLIKVTLRWWASGKARENDKENLERTLISRRCLVSGLKRFSSSSSEWLEQCPSSWTLRYRLRRSLIVSVQNSLSGTWWPAAHDGRTRSGRQSRDEPQTSSFISSYITTMNAFKYACSPQSTPTRTTKYYHYHY